MDQLNPFKVKNELIILFQMTVVKSHQKTIAYSLALTSFHMEYDKRRREREPIQMLGTVDARHILRVVLIF